MYYGTKSISSLGSKIWDLVSNNLKETGDLKVTKNGNLRIALADNVKLMCKMSGFYKTEFEVTVALMTTVNILLWV